MFASFRSRVAPSVCHIVASAMVWGWWGWSALGKGTDREIEFFETRVRPVLSARCERCHSAATGKTGGGLALDTKAGWQRGGDRGVPIVAGQPNQSLLVRAIEYHDDSLQMPPVDEGGRLPASEIAILSEWVSRGAPDPRESGESIGGMTTEEAATWWSFQPLPDESPPVPSVPDELHRHAKNAIDHFILARLVRRNRELATVSGQRNQLIPAPPADKRKLIRRATFDLTGLPPTPAEVNRFVSDTSDDAFAKVVDRLLSSPFYGQRWARHWLDVARYADFYDANPKTRTASCEITEAWRYRDWVVDSLNRDLPYSHFVFHQIAGDLLAPAAKWSDRDVNDLSRLRFDNDSVYPDGLVATTFLTNGVWDRGDADKEKIVSDMVDDNIDTIGKAFLGLTLGCARCHDHKYDPLSTADYYALAGIFYSTHMLKDLGAKGAEYVVNRVPLVPPSTVELRNVQLAELEAIDKAIAMFDSRTAHDGVTPKANASDAEPENKADRTGTDRLRSTSIETSESLLSELVARRARLASQLLRELPVAMAAQEGGTPGGLFPGIQDVPIHIRGSYTRLGEVVPRRLPLIFLGENQPAIQQGSGRWELAQWVASCNNPLTARVIANRVWQWHFGEGLVQTPNNFGKLGVPPSHPELLDWLAWTLVNDRWSLKRLHRHIMLSATYQQASVVGHDQTTIDPENRWLARFSPRRLSAEEIRDAVLFVSGQINQSFGGPAADDFTSQRRSLYVQTARWSRSSFALLFDAANPDASTPKRTPSTVAPQALLFLNHPFTRDLASRLVATKSTIDRPDDIARHVHTVYQIVFSRRAAPEEIALAKEIIVPSDITTWITWAHALICTNEFIYVD